MNSKSSIILTIGNLYNRDGRHKWLLEIIDNLDEGSWYQKWSQILRDENIHRSACVFVFTYEGRSISLSDANIKNNLSLRFAFKDTLPSSRLLMKAGMPSGCSSTAPASSGLYDAVAICEASRLLNVPRLASPPGSSSVAPASRGLYDAVAMNHQQSRCAAQT